MLILQTFSKAIHCCIKAVIDKKWACRRDASRTFQGCAYQHYFRFYSLCILLLVVISTAEKGSRRANVQNCKAEQYPRLCIPWSVCNLISRASFTIQSYPRCLWLCIVPEILECKGQLSVDIERFVQQWFEFSNTVPDSVQSLWCQHTFHNFTVWLRSKLGSVRTDVCHMLQMLLVNFSIAEIC